LFPVSQKNEVETVQRYFFLPLVLLSILFVPANVIKAHATTASSCVSSSGTNTLKGTLDGAYYTIAVPANWNKTLVLYSHGYAFPGEPLRTQASDAPDTQVADALLQEGYALAGSSYSQDGWAVQQAFHDQMALLDYFDATCGQPTRTIAWGSSMGGLITAALAQLYPNRFTAALPMCGVVAGGIGEMNVAVDTMFAFNTLLANDTLQIVHITKPQENLSRADAILVGAQHTPQGRARIALTVALEDMPGELAEQDLDPATQEQNQFTTAEKLMIFNFVSRAEIEDRAGGNPSWTIGVDFRKQLEESPSYSEVVALYQQAGLDLDKDLATLNTAPPIIPDPQAVGYMAKYFIFNGNVNMPILTMHTIGDPLVNVEQEQAYASVVNAAGDSPLLRQVFVNRAGHCNFTDAEMLTAFGTLIQRVDTGDWGDTTDPALLNAEALELGSTLNSSAPAFLGYQPAVFQRPFDARLL
jgi:pimeloyl-ACP methyl ester carboxylesterase